MLYILLHKTEELRISLWVGQTLDGKLSWIYTSGNVLDVLWDKLEWYL